MSDGTAEHYQKPKAVCKHLTGKNRLNGFHLVTYVQGYAALITTKRMQRPHWMEGAPTVKRLGRISTVFRLKLRSCSLLRQAGPAAHLCRDCLPDIFTALAIDMVRGQLLRINLMAELLQHTTVEGRCKGTEDQQILRTFSLEATSMLNRPIRGMREVCTIQLEQPAGTEPQTTYMKLRS